MLLMNANDDCNKFTHYSEIKSSLPILAKSRDKRVVSRLFPPDHEMLYDIREFIQGSSSLAETCYQDFNLWDMFSKGLSSSFMPCIPILYYSIYVPVSKLTS